MVKVSPMAELRFMAITNDEQWVYPVYNEDVNIGYIKYNCFQYKKRYKMIFLDLLEISPEFRNKGYGTEIVKNILGESDLIVGGISNPESMGFWKKFDPKFYIGENDYEYARHRTKNELINPIFFVISDNPLPVYYEQFNALQEYEISN